MAKATISPGLNVRTILETIEPDDSKWLLIASPSGINVTIETVTQQALDDAIANFDPLPDNKLTKIEALKIIRDQKTTQNYLHTDGNEYKTNIENRWFLNSNLGKIVKDNDFLEQAKVGAPPNKIRIRLPNNTFVNKTITEFTNLAEGMSNFLISITGRYLELKDEILTANNQTELETIDIESGFP